MRQDRGALGRAAAGAGDPEHSRRDVGLEVVRVGLRARRASRRAPQRGRAGVGPREQAIEDDKDLIMEATLEATRRDTFGRNNAGRLRRAGRIPAVLYGGDIARGRAGRGRPEGADADSAFAVRASTR